MPLCDLTRILDPFMIYSEAQKTHDKSSGFSNTRTLPRISTV